MHHHVGGLRNVTVAHFRQGIADRRGSSTDKLPDILEWMLYDDWYSWDCQAMGLLMNRVNIVFHFLMWRKDRFLFNRNTPQPGASAKTWAHREEHRSTPDVLPLPRQASCLNCNSSALLLNHCCSWVCLWIYCGVFKDNFALGIS